MRSPLKVLLICLLTHQATAQLNNFWIQGYNETGVPNPVNMVYSLDFRNGIISYDTAYLHPFSFREACSVVCDSAGNLLFYTNGVAIQNSEHDTMINGYNLSYTNELIISNGELSGLHNPQPIVIVPQPGQSDIYYLFHHYHRIYPGIDHAFIDTLYYSLIDMTQDSGRGAVTDRNHAFWIGNPNGNDIVAYGSYTACKHANGRDWWIMTHKDSSNIFMRFLLTPNGILGPYSQAIGDTVNYLFQQSCFSPDGTKYAHVHADTQVHLYDFDRCTGLFSNYQHLTGLYSGNMGSVGICFSPNSQLLYATAGAKAYQWNVTIPNVASSYLHIATVDSFICPQFGIGYYLMQAAADGKIYISSPNSSSCMSVIENPDLLGFACNFVNHGIDNLPYWNAYTVPYYPNYYLGSLPGSPCDTLTAVQMPVAEEIKVRVYPNPAKDKIKINYSIENDATFYITDLTGKIIFENQLENSEKISDVSLEKIPAGIYFWKTEGINSAYGKLIIIK